MLFWVAMYVKATKKKKNEDGIPGELIKLSDMGPVLVVAETKGAAEASAMIDHADKLKGVNKALLEVVAVPFGG